MRALSFLGWIKQPAAQGQHRFFERYRGYKKNIGGEGGIRTLDELLTHTPLAGERLRPLGHLSGDDAVLPEISEMARWEGVEPPTFWFVARRSIQLSYQRGEGAL